jgi:hypothetical protein
MVTFISRLAGRGQHSSIADIFDAQTVPARRDPEIVTIAAAPPPVSQDHKLVGVGIWREQIA